MNTNEEKLGGSFGWLNATQFLGALNDNIFKMLIILFLIKPLGADAVSAVNVTALAGAVFVVPFLLFIALAGKLADRFSKRNIIVWTKVAEIVVMVVGCAAFLSESAFGLYCVLFLMATQSAFFGPSKYGIIPELVKREQLSQANGLLVAMTYLAIVIGMALGPFLTQITGGHFVVMSAICITVAVLGLVVSLKIPRTPAVGVIRPASWFFVRDIWRTLRDIRRDRDLFLAVIASAYFLLIGGFTYSNLIPYGISHLGLNGTQSGYLFVLAAIGIGAGSFWAGKLSGRKVELGVIPLGAIGLTFSSTGLGFIPGLYLTFVLVFIMGVSAGLFIVPIRAFIQLRSPRQRLGEILAASGFLGWIGVLLASGLIYCFTNLWGLSSGQVFMVLGMMTLIPTIVTIMLLPDFLARFLCVFLTRLCYRIKVSGIENMPADRSVLLVCNHVSWADALLLTATQQRRIRFIMDKSFYNKWWLRPIYKLMKVIPISADNPPKKIINSLRQSRAAMDEGFMVCIFAEGVMTGSGMMAEFKGELERITKQSSYDIVPVYIGGAWGSVFSYYGGRVLPTLPGKFPYPVSIHYGEPMPATATSSQIRQKVLELSCDYFNSLKSKDRSLGGNFVKVARKNWSKRCISDGTGRRLNYGKTLVSSIAFGIEIDKLTEAQEKIGILLPPSAGTAIANLAVTLLGKVAVNLNYTASIEAMEAAIQQCDIKCVISSRKFVKRVDKLDTLPGIVFIEDLLEKIKFATKLKAYLKGRFMPYKLFAKAFCKTADDMATVIFSSGSTGQPKGIMLSHHNILSNIEAVRMVIHIKTEDNLCGVLPFFHALGFTCGLWLPLASGISSVFIANPLDGKLVGNSVRENKSTVLFSSPTFLANYIRRAKREDFSSLRLVFAGAEKLTERLAESFEEHFGICPFEGYGATELSPVVTLNIPDTETAGVFRVGNKAGTVGHPIPGVVVKIVDIESSQTLQAGQEGLIMVKGANVMCGYLNMEKETAEVLKNGWYNTSDIGYMDSDGFVTITGRLSRFSKIAGEMVPLLAVEQEYLHGLGTDEQVVAVTSVPDAKKGEELVVLYLETAGNADWLHEIITESNMPNIWKPKRDNYIKIDSMPMLGSGKLDVIKLHEIAIAVKNVSES